MTSSYPATPYITFWIKSQRSMVRLVEGDVADGAKGVFNA